MNMGVHVAGRYNFVANKASPKVLEQSVLQVGAGRFQLKIMRDYCHLKPFVQEIGFGKLTHVYLLFKQK